MFGVTPDRKGASAVNTYPGATTNGAGAYYLHNGYYYQGGATVSLMFAGNSGYAGPGCVIACELDMNKVISCLVAPAFSFVAVFVVLQRQVRWSLNGCTWSEPRALPTTQVAYSFAVGLHTVGMATLLYVSAWLTASWYRRIREDPS